MAEVPSSHRQVSEVLPTPLVGDVLFSERKVMQAQNVPAYGTAHPNTAKWPNHKFVYARERNEPGSQSTFDFFYAAERSSQDLYNFEAGWTQIGGIMVRSVKRSYVTPRADYVNITPPVGEAMPRDPDNKFSDGYILYKSEQVRIEPPLDSLFVVEERLYILHEGAVGESTGTWGVEGDTEDLVLEDDATPSGFGIKQSQVSPIGNGQAIEKVVRYPLPQEVGGSIVHTLEAEEHDELTGAVIEIRKRLVNATTAKGVAATMRVEGEYTEIKPLDKWHSIVMGARIKDESLDEQTWYETRNISLPDSLDRVGIIWDSNHDKDEGASGVDNISTIISEKYNWSVSANAAIVGSVVGRPFVLIKNGFRGAAKVKVVRTFHDGPPDIDDFAPELFEPVYGTLSISGMSKSVSAQSNKNGVGDISISSGGRVRFSENKKLAIQQIGPVVYDSYELENIGDPQAINEVAIALGGSTPGGGLYPAATATLNISGIADLDLPESSRVLRPGDKYILHVEVRPWRLGWWIREVYEAEVPGGS
jgi:hypothetical protein